MGIAIKIILAAFNLFCLAYTIAFPSPLTPLSIVPFVITAGYWTLNNLFLVDNSDYEGQSLRAWKLVNVLFLIIAVAVIGISGFVGFTHDLTKQTDNASIQDIASQYNNANQENVDQFSNSNQEANQYVFTRKTGYGIATNVVSYNEFSTSIFIVVIVLLVAEIFCELFRPKALADGKNIYSSHYIQKLRKKNKKRRK